MHILLLQHDPVPGDFSGNAARLAGLALKAAAESPDPAGGRTLCLTPAYAIAGVPWDSLPRISGFYRRCRDACIELAEMLAGGPDMLVTLTGAEEPLYALLSKGSITSIPRSDSGILVLPGGLKLLAPLGGTARAIGLPSQGENSGWKKAAAVLLQPSVPFRPGLFEERETHCAAFASMKHIPVLSVSQYGACDSLVYPGQSFIINASGETIARAAAFGPAVLSADLGTSGITARALSAGCGPAPDAVSPDPGRAESMFRAAVLGIRDYVRKCGMTGVVIGLSGGMDSALVAVMAAEALGPENVLGVLMPSRWSSDHSEGDAEKLAANLGIETRTARITPMMDAYAATLAPLFEGLPRAGNDLTDENIQPRIRGALLMAFANRTGRAVLGTGNKSENAMGYCTLYGDTVGALEPISDIYKTEVYDLARWYNESKGSEIIPEHVFTKPPSAELHPGQVDEDSLPPYDVLDRILREIIENGANPETLIMPGIDDSVVREVAGKLARAEFKRHQCPPGIKMSSATFGIEWRIPATARFLSSKK